MEVSSAPRGRLGPAAATALVVGNMIGSGVFLLPASLAPYGGVSILGWLFTTAGAMLLALSFARLSRLVPDAGGPYAYTRRGFGDFAGFLVAWGYWISIWAGNAAIAVGFVGYAAFFVPVLGSSPALAALAALLAIWSLTWVNARGVKEAGGVQLVTTVVKLVPLLAIALFGLFHFEPAHFVPFHPSGGSLFGAIGATATLTLWAFLGLESATVPAEDVVDPLRTIPRATLVGTALAAAVYIGGTVAVMGLIPPGELASSSAPFADAARRMWGEWAGYLVALGAMVSCYGALNGWIMLQGQVPWAAARDGLFPARFARKGGRGTPVFGLVVSSVLVTVLMAANYTRPLVDLFTFIILLSTLTALVPYAFVTLSELLIGKPTRRTVVLASLAFLYALWAIAGAGMDIVYWGFLLLMAGIPVYVWLRRRPSAAVVAQGRAVEEGLARVQGKAVAEGKVRAQGEAVEEGRVRMQGEAVEEGSGEDEGEGSGIGP